jgi:Protein of unknown function (DUF2971)
MRSKIFFYKETFKDITERDGLDAKRFEFDGDMYFPFKKKFGFFIKTIQLEFKEEEVIKLDGNIHNNFTLYVVRHFSTSGQTNAGKNFIKEFYTIKEFSFSCTDGLAALKPPIVLDRIFYEIHDKYVQRVLKKKDFNYREIVSLAHYAMMETAIEHILPQNKLWLNELYKTNDPVESKKSFYKFIIINENKDLLDEYIKQKGYIFSLKDDFEKMVKSISFSKDTTARKGYGLPTMWAHYGQKHRGVCLILDQVILKKLFKDQFGYRFKSNPILYDKLEIPDLKKEENESSEEFFLKHADELFFKKDFDWGSESEYRFVVVNPEKVEEDGKCFLEHIDQALIAIVLGVDFNENYKCSIKNLCDRLPNKNIGLYQLSFDNGEFKLNEENGNNLFDFYIVDN